MRGVDGAESVADHSWGTALLCLHFAAAARAELPSLDADRALAMAVVHDLAEVATGDTPYDPAAPADRALKAARERAALDRLFPDDHGAQTIALWQEYEEARTDTARFVRDMNLVEMCLQAKRYQERDGHPLIGEFSASSRPRAGTDLARGLIDAIAGR